jgi:hypothetical protein
MRQRDSVRARGDEIAETSRQGLAEDAHEAVLLKVVLYQLK